MWMGLVFIPFSPKGMPKKLLLLPNPTKWSSYGKIYNLGGIFFFKILFIHERRREREREAETQAEGEAGSLQGARRGTWSQDPGVTPWAEGGAKPLCPPTCPKMDLLNSFYLREKPYFYCFALHFPKPRWGQTNLQCSLVRLCLFLRQEMSFYSFSRAVSLWGSDHVLKCGQRLCCPSDLLRRRELQARAVPRAQRHCPRSQQCILLLFCRTRFLSILPLGMSPWVGFAREPLIAPGGRGTEEKDDVYLRSFCPIRVSFFRPVVLFFIYFYFFS